MNEAHRLQYILAGKSLLQEGCINTEDFDLYKKNIISETPVFPVAYFNDLKNAYKEIGKGLTEEEYEYIKKDFISGKSIIDANELTRYRLLFDSKAITAEEFVHIKATLFSGKKIKTNIEEINYLERVNSWDVITEHEYNCFHNASLFGRKIPSEKQFGILKSYKKFLDDGLISSEEYNDIKRYVFSGKTLKDGKNLNDLYDYKKLLSEGAINQEDYDKYKREIMPEKAACNYTLPSIQPLISDPDTAVTDEGTSVNAYQIVEKQKEAQKKKHDHRIKVLKRCLAIACIISAVSFAGSYITQKVIVPNNKYKAAVSLYEEGKYHDAILAFTEIEDYRDSKKQIEKCREALIEENYQAAINAISEGKYDKAIGVFKALGDYKQSQSYIEQCEEAIKEEKYNNAVKLFNDGEYKQALVLLETITDYKDSKEIISKCRDKLEKTKTSSLKVGDTLNFGSYFQDADYSSRIKSPVKWVVIEKEDNKVLLLSEKALDCVQFSENNQDTWENSDIRNWLNSTFVDSCFSSRESKQLITNNGEDTDDKVFLLSETDYKNYLVDKNLQSCHATQYAHKKGARTTGVDKTQWWLSTQGTKENCIKYVNFDGSIDTEGALPLVENIGVRPAIWIDIDK